MAALRAVTVYYRSMLMMVAAGGHHEFDALRVICNAPRVDFWSKYERKQESIMTEDEVSRLFAATYLHSIGLMFKLWSEPHYRADNLQTDLINNLQNIAIPGTGIPVSLLCSHLRILQAYLLLVHPLVVAISALFISKSTEHGKNRSVIDIFADELIAPGHWFALWRMNSVLVAAHHHNSRPAVKEQYKYENKWDFLDLMLRKRSSSSWSELKATPVIEDIRELVCKHKNIEGGMGIHIFKNALHGGDWILQKRLYNDAELQRVLPSDAPLSTYRVITMLDPTAETFEDRHIAMTTVFRAGRSGKDTDHSSVLMPVDGDTLMPGKMFRNWYQVGFAGKPVLSSAGITDHPDTGFKLAGVRLASASSATSMCIEAHRRMMPNVPAIGWDVAMADGEGAVLLEANLSCNLFGGVYDKSKYVRIMDTFFANNCKAHPLSTKRAEAKEDSTSESDDYSSTA
eukprot:gene1112-1706_t